MAEWVHGCGWIEIGDQDWQGFVVRALNEGGLVYEKEGYHTLAEPMEALERGWQMASRERLMDRNFIGNLFDNIPADLPEEAFTTILQANDFGSSGSFRKAKPPRLDSGTIRRRTSGSSSWRAAPPCSSRASPSRSNSAGLYLNIPAHVRHRVAWTDPNQKTVWLAIHYRG